MYRTSKLKVIFGILTMAALVVSFQNCSSPLEFSKIELKSLANGNGTGYDGKPFVNHGFCGDTDDLAVKSILVVKGDGSADLLRYDCADLSVPVSVPKSGMKSPASDPSVFVYKDEIFDEVAPANGSKKKFTRALCWAMPGVTFNTEIRVWHHEDPFLPGPKKLYSQMKCDDGYNSGTIANVVETLVSGTQAKFSASDAKTGYSFDLDLYLSGTRAYGSSTFGGGPATSTTSTGGLECFTQGIRIKADL